MPAPDCVTAPVLEMMPESVSVPVCMKLTVPALATLFEKVEPVAIFSASVAPLAVLTALELEIEPVVPLPICNVPALMVVAPV